MLQTNPKQKNTHTHTPPPTHTHKQTNKKTKTKQNKKKNQYKDLVFEASYSSSRNKLSVYLNQVLITYNDLRIGCSTVYCKVSPG